MLDILKILVFVNATLMIVKCHIPSLSVQKVDRNLIEKKRRESLDMCLIFNSEKEKMEPQAHSKTEHKSKRRYKRGVEEEPPTNMEAAKQVESIVDKLYDDMSEIGQKVTYRRRNLDKFTTVKGTTKMNSAMRRFNFAPSALLGPDNASSTEPSIDQGTAAGMPWHKKWKHGIVPYFIDSMYYDSQLADVIRNAFDHFEKSTCIRLQKLREKPTDSGSLKKVEWLFITNPMGIKQCVHSNEHKVNEGVQMVVIGYDCMSTGEILHEVMHVLGFSHEHNRPDRNQHITIEWSNIKPGYKKYFQMRPRDFLMNIPYDYMSVLHYPPRAFSKNGQLTIVARTPGQKIGQREGLSESDVEKVGTVFGHECVERNREYLLSTCPSVVKNNLKQTDVSTQQITEYFKNRLWPFGLVNYKLKDKVEFSSEERENIKAVIKHIEMETCIRFKDVTEEMAKDESKDDDNESNNKSSSDATDVDQAHKTLALSESKPSTSQESNNQFADDIQVSSDAIVLNENQAMSDVQESNDNNTVHATIDDSDSPSLNQSNQNVSENEIKSGPDDNAKLTETESSEEIRSGRNKIRNASRRHASNIVTLERSPESGCICPPPGRPNGNTVLKISSDCFNSANDLLHMFVHILGLDHQHNMHDRDSYIHIVWENMTSEVKYEMQDKLPPAASVGFSYDYQSVMHYPWLQIKNGIANIMYPVWNDGWAMGHWQGLSSVDVQKLNQLYSKQCNERRNNERRKNI